MIQSLPPDFSVLINTYNRPAALAQAVEALECQADFPRERFEIVVVDDGGALDARTALEKAGLLAGVAFRRIEHAGPGAARNAALAMANGRWILFLGDDIVASPGLLAAHARFLEASGAEKRMSLGHAEWDMGRVSKPFYEFARAHHYDGLAPGQELDFRYFYTCNVALPKLALESAGGFDESFTSYGWDDTDLGYRLAERGWRLYYTPEACARHVHPPVTIPGLLRRQIELGFGGCRFYAKHRSPEAERAAFWPGSRQARSGPEWRLRLGAALAWALERMAPESALLWRVYGRMVFSCRVRGVEWGRREFPDAGI